jgi:hypothetical protein
MADVLPLREDDLPYLTDVSGIMALDDSVYIMILFYAG